MVLVGFDDTDSSSGMCTTFLCLEVLSSLPDGIDLIGLPRLVRLNPNVPWKTRGNGAVSFEAGRGAGEPVKVGEWNGMDVLSFPEGGPVDDVELLIEHLEDAIERRAMMADERTEPGLMVSDDRPPEELYWRGVRAIVHRDELSDANDKAILSRGWKDGRGLIGAVCATAWPGEAGDHTYEAIAYRSEGNWGTERTPVVDRVLRLDDMFPSTFNNHDHEEGKPIIYPNSPCPVLFGIRGEDLDELQEARRFMSEEGERPGGWLLYLTNQGTDDHIQEAASIEAMEPFGSYRIGGKVSKGPRTIEGGHVLFSVGDDEGGSLEVAAYEPTKGFRRIVRRLRTGDMVEIYGSMRPEPATFNLEKLRVVELFDSYIKVENPTCPSCEKHMKSRGKGSGFKCILCGETATEEQCVFAPEHRGLTPGFYEACPSAHRHLHRPLKRMGHGYRQCLGGTNRVL